MGLTRGCSAPASNTEPLAWLVPPAQTFGAGHGAAAQAWPLNPPIAYCSPWLSRYLCCSLGSAGHKLFAPPSTSGSNEMPPAPLEPGTPGAHLTIRNTEGIWVISRGSVTPPPPASAPATSPAGSGGPGSAAQDGCPAAAPGAPHRPARAQRAALPPRRGQGRREAASPPLPAGLRRAPGEGAPSPAPLTPPRSAEPSAHGPGPTP